MNTEKPKPKTWKDVVSEELEIIQGLEMALQIHLAILDEARKH